MEEADGDEPEEPAEAPERQQELERIDGHGEEPGSDKAAMTGPAQHCREHEEAAVMPPKHPIP